MEINGHLTITEIPCKSKGSYVTLRDYIYLRRCCYLRQNHILFDYNFLYIQEPTSNNA